LREEREGKRREVDRERGERGGKRERERELKGLGVTESKGMS
jgi:hypothetical protein